MARLGAHGSETHAPWFKGPELMGESSENPQIPLGCTVPVQAVGPQAWPPPRRFQHTGRCCKPSGDPQTPPYSRLPGPCQFLH